MSEYQDNPEQADKGPGRVRASDADRDRAVARLRTHHEEGRLDASEFEERMSAALSARYCDELPPLLADLPPQRSDHGDEQTPPWSRGAHRTGPPVWHRWRALPLLPLLAVLVVVSSVSSLLHGNFPLLLLVGALLLWKFRGGHWHGERTQRRWGWQGPPSAAHKPE